MKYVVRFSDGNFLVLNGPFCYERSTSDIQQATLMFRSQATAYASMWNAEVVQVG